MLTKATSRKAVMLTLDAVIRFDNKAIIEAKSSEAACRIAEHLLARLEHHKAPRRYYELALKGGLLKRKEVEKNHFFLMFDKSVLSLAIRFGLHGTSKTKEQLITIARYFKTYWYFRQTVATLRNGPLTREEFIDMAQKIASQWGAYMDTNRAEVA